MKNANRAIESDAVQAQDYRREKAFSTSTRSLKTKYSFTSNRSTQVDNVMLPSLSIGQKPKTAKGKLKDQKPLEFKDLKDLSLIWSIYTRHRRIAYIKLEIITT
jgi:hypothetical protein